MCWDNEKGRGIKMIKRHINLYIPLKQRLQPLTGEHKQPQTKESLHTVWCYNVPPVSLRDVSLTIAVS